MTNETKQEKDKKEPPSTVKALLTLVIFGFCSLSILWSVFSSDGAKYNVEVACTAARSNGFICNPELVMETWPNAVDFCEETVGNKPIDYELYGFCLRNEGVYMG